MIVGTHTARSREEQINLVLRASKDLDFSLTQKAERMRQGPGKGYNVIGVVEQIIFEVDTNASVPSLQELGADVTGRRLYWPDEWKAPIVARTIPEEDLIFTRPWPLRRGLVSLPDVPDPKHIVSNPYKVDETGASHLKTSADGRTVEGLELPRMRRQEPEKIASAKSGRFLVFHPIAQIILLMVARNAGRSEMRFGTFGTNRLPLSSLTGFDDRKMALLLDPYTGEAYFTGGRYQMHAPDVAA